MKITTYFFLVMFTAFIATPTVVSFIEYNEDVYTISFMEEEKGNNSVEELKKNFELSEHSFADLYNEKVEENFNFRYFHIIATIYLDPVSPPPRVV